MARSPAEHEATLLQQKRLDARIKTARMRYRARIKDVNYRAPSGLDRAILDRIVHDAYRVELRGETLRNRIDNAVDGASLPQNQTICAMTCARNGGQTATKTFLG